MRGRHRAERRRQDDADRDAGRPACAGGGNDRLRRHAARRTVPARASANPRMASAGQCRPVSRERARDRARRPPPASLPLCVGVSRRRRVRPRGAGAVRRRGDLGARRAHALGRGAQARRPGGAGGAGAPPDAARRADLASRSRPPGRGARRADRAGARRGQGDRHGAARAPSHGALRGPRRRACRRPGECGPRRRNADGGAAHGALRDAAGRRRRWTRAHVRSRREASPRGAQRAESSASHSAATPSANRGPSRCSRFASTT